MGVVVRRYIDFLILLIPTHLASLLFVHFSKCFSFFYLLVETGQHLGAGLTQADKTCIQLNFYLEILKGGHLGFKAPLVPPPPVNATLRIV